MQLVSSHNIDQYCYCKNQPIYTSLNKTTKNFIIEKSKPKAKKLKAPNSSLCLNQDENTKTSNKVQKEKKNHWR